MFKKWVIVFLLIIPITYADLGDKESVISEITLDAGVEFKKSPNSKLQTFNAEVKFYPKDFDKQTVISFDAFGEGAEIRDASYSWDRDIDDASFGYVSKVKTKSVLPIVRDKIKFPIKKLDKDLLYWTQTTDFVDIDENIRKQASEIVEGEDDLYKAVVKLAEWSRANIEYDLNTLTAESVQKSSWVLENRFGVCDELTNLFTSFVRSLNIPVRYVSGMTYTDAIGGWGAHAWSEVYFPDHGWIPFDVTFGQYGRLGPGHIKMNEGLDAKEPSVVYNWRGVNVDMGQRNFDVDERSFDVE